MLNTIAPKFITIKLDQFTNIIHFLRKCSIQIFHLSEHTHPFVSVPMRDQRRKTKEIKCQMKNSLYF